VRKKIDDIRQTLPSGIVDFFNDEFGDTYSLIFADLRRIHASQLRDVADRLRPEILRRTT
jgi:multidrug efflux pump